MTTLSVTIYSTGPTCQGCRITERALTDKGVPFVVVDLRTEPEAHEYVTGELGYSEAPVVVVEDGTGRDHWSGVRPDHIARVAGLNAE